VGVVLTTVCLSLGFSTLMLSQFETIQAMGAATAATMLIALSGDLVLLPSMLVLAGYRRFDHEVDPGSVDDVGTPAVDRRAAA